MIMHKLKDSNTYRTYRKSIIKPIKGSYKNAKKLRISETSKKSNLAGKKRNRTSSQVIISFSKNRITSKIKKLSLSKS